MRDFLGETFHTNCLLWSLAHVFLYGGRLKWRWSHRGFHPHIMWQPPQSDKVLSFVPVDKRWMLCAPWRFDGIVEEE